MQAGVHRGDAVHLKQYLAHGTNHQGRHPGIVLLAEIADAEDTPVLLQLGQRLADVRSVDRCIVQGRQGLVEITDRLAVLPGQYV